MSAEELFKKAESMMDKEEITCKSYIWLLERIYEASFNQGQARHYKEFRDACGGIKKFNKELDDALGAMTMYLRETEGD